MVYLDYTANTPVHEDVLSVFSEVSRNYIANPNAAHRLGRDALKLMNESSGKILELLNLTGRQVVYTSGATEANNLAIFGTAHEYKNFGRHVISTYLEHSSVNGPLAALQEEGFEIDYLDTEPDGSINLRHLKELMRRDTILVSVCAVDSETGVTQDIEAISGIVSAFPNCRLHTDATQAIGKSARPLSGADLITCAPHKFYGLTGSGILLVRDGLRLEPQMHGGLSTSSFRSGTPSAALAAAASKALELALDDFDSKYQRVDALNKKLWNALGAFPKVRFNSSNRSVPHILSISIPGTDTEKLKEALEADGICLSTRSACCAPNSVSRPVYAMTKDRKRALAPLRISLSHLTTDAELDQFIKSFHKCYSVMVG